MSIVGEAVQSLIDAETEAFGRNIQFLTTTAQLTDDLTQVYDSLLLVFQEEAHSLDEYQVISSSICLQSMRYQLIAGTLTQFRGHISDSCSYTRKAIECAAFIVEILQDEQSGKRWLEFGRSAGARRRYKSRFMAWEVVIRAKNILGPQLLDLYETLCLSVHPSYVSVIRQIENSVDGSGPPIFHNIDVRSERDLEILALSYFMLLDTHLMSIDAVRTALYTMDSEVDFSKFNTKLSAIADAHTIERSRWRDLAERLRRELVDQ